MLRGLHSFVPSGSWEEANTGTLFASATLGGSCRQAIAMAQETEAGVFVFLEFDEDEVVDLTRQTGLSIAELLAPYVAALEKMPGCAAVGMGFELSPPTDTNDDSLVDAGISQYFAWDVNNEKWLRKELLPLPMVGHYL